MVAMLRPLAWCLSLGAASVALTVSTGGATAPFVSALLGGAAGGAAGNFAHEVCKALDQRVASRLLEGRSGLAENHVVIQELRLAQLEALATILERFDAMRATNRSLPQGDEAQRFSEELAKLISEETSSTRTLALSKEGDLTPTEAKLRRAVLSSLPEAFDRSLAARRLTGDRTAIEESLRQIRGMVEAAVLAELKLTLLARGEEPPASFLTLFAGVSGFEGWFDLFIQDAAGRIKSANAEHGQAFEKIWNAEQLALVKAIAEAHTAVLVELNERTKRIEQDQTKQTNLLQELLSRTNQDTAVNKINCGDYFLAVRAVLDAYGAFISLARWQFSANSLQNKGRHWYVNAAVLIYMCAPEKWDALYKVIAACDAHESALVSFLAVAEPKFRGHTVIIRHEIAKLRHVIKSFIEIMDTGNTANPDDIGFNALAIREAILSIVSGSGFTPNDVNELDQILAFRQFISQRQCCPMPLDNIFNTAFETVTPKSMSLLAGNDIFYSFLDTAYCRDSQTASNRNNRNIYNADLAKRAQCIVYCRIFLNWRSVQKEMDEYTESSDGHQTAKHYVLSYARGIVKEAAAFLESKAMITKGIKEYWEEIAGQPDFEIEAMFDADAEIEKARGNLDMLQFRWITPEGLFRVHPFLI
jgi:hypothetical protein